MKHILVTTFITLLALGMGCAWISPASETASDGINVHGHWTVTVTNPDGTVDAVHEFENSIDPVQGASFLTALLAGETAMNANQTLRPPYRLGMNGSIQNSSFRCEENHSNIQTNRYRDRDYINGIYPRIEADMHRERTSTGSPLELSGICTVVATPAMRLEIHDINDVYSEFYPTDVIWYRSANMTEDVVETAPRLTVHTFNSPILVRNRQVIGLNVIISFD